MKKKITIFLIVMLAAVSALSAVTFTWSSTYDNVTHFRYQFNTDKADNWIMVGPYDTKKSYDLPPGTSIYVQQSVDGGKTWSKSGHAVYDPATAEPWIEEGAEAPAVTEAEVPAVSKAEPQKGAEPLPLIREEKKPVERPAMNRGVKRSSRFALTFRIPSIAIDLQSRPFDYDQYAGLSFRFKNVASPNPWFGLHIAADLDWGMLSSDGFPKDPVKDTEKAIGLDVMFHMSFLLKNKIDLYTGPGIGVDVLMKTDGFANPAVPICWEMPGKIELHEIFGIAPFRMGATLFAAYDLGFEYDFNPVFAVGLNARFKYWFSSFSEWEQNRMSLGLNAQVSFTF